MHDYDNSIKIFIFICISSVFGFGYIIGFKIGEQSPQKETINFCVEKPADCKTKNDYFKLLENQK